MANCAYKKTSLSGKVSSPFTFIQAALFQWVNPKAWVMASTTIAVYTSAAEDVLHQILLLAVAFALIGFCSGSTWLFLGRGLKQFLTSDTHQILFNRVMATLLVASVFPAIYEMGFRLLV